MTLSGYYIDSLAGKVLLTVHGKLTTKKVILCLPPLFEEMNLSRAVIAKQAQHFAAQGMATCVLDYFGTGDSEGEIEEATAQLWLEDILAAGRWLQAGGVEQIILWGVRFGGLLMLHFQNMLHDNLPIASQLLWKPVTAGKLYMSQFIRLKQANAMMMGSTEKINWRQRIADGETVEIAGYPINGALMGSIEDLTVAENFTPRSFVAWLELATTEISPAIQRIVSQWHGVDYRLEAASCAPFWQIPETFTVPHLYPLSLALLQD